jgi:hypothetical protein
MENNNIKLILDQWQASLKSKDRKKDSVKTNFEELFQSWKNAGASFEDLYETFLPIAIKAHLPSSSIIRNTFNTVKHYNKKFDKSEKEFSEDWNKSIHDTATSTFFEYFKSPLFDQDDEPKVFGNMSAKEYKAQRRYAEQFPILDTTELEKQWQDSKYNLDIDDMIKNVLGEE